MSLPERVLLGYTPSLLGQDREEVLSLLNHCLHFLSPLAPATRAVKGKTHLCSQIGSGPYTLTLLIARRGKGVMLIKL